MAEDNFLYDDSDRSESTRIEKIGVMDRSPGINKILGNTISKDYTPATSRPTYLNDGEDAKQEGELQHAAGVVRVADSPEAEEWVTTKQLYEKTLGVTEYDELRAKLHLKPNESFTDYYNKTHYIPEGFQMQAKLLLAEEKRKKLYAEVEAGKMSEEDFLYEAYGKDLLKEQGIDFSSSLYWYNKRKNKDYDDPRKNDTFMLQLISDAREIFQHELWYEACAKTTMEDIGKYVTGEVLSTDAVFDLFEDQLSQLTDYFESREQIIKYYRAGLLQGFNPTIDVEGDGKIDYYLSTDGKLYNVNETGEGANTYKAYYNDDGSLNRIVASDSLAGEIASEAVKGFIGFFTDVVDLVGMVGGLFVDLGEGVFGKGWDLSATTEVSASMSQFWNSTWLGDRDYLTSSGFKNSDGSINGAGIARQGSRLVGTILGFVATMGIGAAVGGASAGAKAGVTAAKEAGEAAFTAAMKKGLGTAAAKAAKRQAYRAAMRATKETAKKALIAAGKNTVMHKIGRGIGKVGKAGINTAVKLTGWANGVGSGSGTIGAILGNAAVTSMKDAINGGVNLTINRGYMYESGMTDHLLSDGEILGKSMAVFGTEFVVAAALRSAVGTQALDRWAGVAKGVKDKAITGLPTFLKYSPQLLKVTAQSAGKRVAVGLTNMAMDGVENILSAWIQTSYSTKGKVLDWESLGRTLDSPSLWMNLGWQTLNNYKDNFSISGNELAAASLKANEINADMKNYLTSMAASKMDDEVALNAIRQLMQTYDDLVIKYTEETGSQATGILKAFEEVATKSGLYDSAVPGSYKQGETWKKFSDEQMKALNPVDKAAQRAFDLHTKMNVEYTSAMFDFINGIQGKWLEVNTNIFKKAGFRILYGKDAINPTVKLMENLRKVYANDPANMDWEASIANSFAKTDLFNKLSSELGEEGSDVFKALDDPQLTMGVLVRDDKTGEWKLTGALAEVLKDNPTEQQKYLAYAQERINNGEANQVASEIYILGRNKGTSVDGDDNRIDGIKYLDIITNLLDTVSPKETGNDVIEKFGDAYVIKFHSMADQAMNVEQIKGMIQTLAAIKISAIDSAVLSSNKSAKLMHLLFSYLTESQADADKIFETEDSAIMSAQVINLMLQKNLINYSEASRLIENLEAYLADKNKDIEGAPKALPALDSGKLSSESKLKGITGSVDLSNYKTALMVRDAITKIEDAQQALVKLRAGGKQTSSDQTAIDNCASLLKNSTLENILLKEHVITPKFKETLNPFMQGQTDKVSKVSLRKSDQTSRIYSDEEKRNLKKDLLNSLYNSLGLDNSGITSSTESIQLRINRESNKFDTLDIPLADITKGRSFAKFVSTYIGKEAFKELKSAGLDLTKTSRINTLESLDKFIEASLPKASNAELITSSRKKLAEGFNRYKHEVTKALLNKYNDADNNILYAQIAKKTGLSTDTITRIIFGKASVKAEDKVIRDRILDSYNTNDIVSHISKYAKDTQATQTYEALSAKYDILFKDAVDIKSDGTVILRLNELQGNTLNSSLNRLENPYTLNRIQEKDMDHTAIAKEVVGLGNLSKFNSEENELNYLREVFGDELVVTQAEAKEIFRELGYSFTGQFKYTPNNSVAGVYFNENQKGYHLGSSKVLMNIADMANTKSKRSTHARVLIKDPQSTADALMPLNIKPLNEAPTSTDIVLKPIDIENSAVYSTRYLERLKSNNKIGKAASLTPEAVAEYKAPIVGSQYNEDHRLYLTMHNLINALDEYVTATGKNKQSKAPVEIVISKQSGKKAKDITKYYGELYQVNVDDSDPNVFKVTLTTQQLKEGEFATKAFKLIEKEGLTHDTIHKILPNNINTKAQGNPINALGLDSTSLSGAQTPVAFAYNWLNKNNYDPNYLRVVLLEAKGNSTPIDISNKLYEDYKTLVTGKTQEQILALTDNNIFLSMKQDEIRNDQKLLELFNNKLLSLYSEEDDVTISNISRLLNSEDMRRNISNALYKLLLNTKKYFDSDGYLKIDSELLTNLRRTITVSTKDGSDYSQALADDTALSAYLSLQSIFLIKKISTDPIEDTLEQKVYSMIRSATMTGSDDSFIAIKDLTRLSDEELDELNNILVKAGAKPIDERILDTIKELEFRHSKVSKEPIEYTVEQAETIQNTHTSSHGYIMSKEDYNNKDYPITNEALTSMIERQKKNLNGDLFVKMSVITNDVYKQNDLTQALLNRTRSKTGLLNYVSYPGSIIKTNFNYKLAEYNFLNSLTDFAIQLKEMEGFSHLDNDTLMSIALEVYDRSSGTEFQSVHPDYIIVNNKGEIVDTVESNYAGVFPGETDPLRNLLGSLLKQEDTTGMHIIRLHRNSLNNLYGYSTEPLEVYSVDRNRDSIIRMIKQRQDAIQTREGLKSNNRDMIVAKTAEYFAKGEMGTPKFYTDQLYSLGKSLGINEDAIRDLITSEEAVSALSHRRTLQEEATNTLFNGTFEDEQTNYQLQQMRDIQSYGETKYSFHKHAGIEDAIEDTKYSIKESLTLFDTNASKFENIVDAFKDNDLDKVKAYAKAFIKSLPDDQKDLGVTELLKYFISEHDSIASELYMLSKNSIEDTLKDSSKEFSEIKLQKYNATSKMATDNSTMKLSDVKACGKLIIDLEQFYDDTTGKEHIFQIAYKYIDRMGLTTEGVIYLPIDGYTRQTYENTFKSYFTKYGTEEGAMNAFKALLDPNTKSNTLAELSKVIALAKQDGALLVGYNSNSFDIPKLINSSQTEVSKVFKDIADLECLDIFELAKRLPTTNNVDAFNGKLRLSELGNYLGFKIDGAHDAKADINLTELIMHKLIDSAVKQDKHHNKFSTDIKDFYTAISNKNIEDTNDYKLVLGQDLDKSITDIVNNINKYKNNPSKFYDFTQIKNQIQEKALNDYANIRRKEIEQYINTHNAGYDIAFAEAMANPTYREETLDLIGFALANVKSTSSSRDTIEDRMPNVISMLNNYLHKKYSTKRDLATLLSDTNNLRAAILTGLNKTEEDFKSYRIEDKENYLEELSSTYTMTSKDLQVDDSAYYVSKVIKPLDTLVDKYLVDGITNPTIQNIVKKRYNDAILRFYDKAGTKDGRIKNKKYTANNVVNFYSNIHEDVLTYLKQSPVISRTFDSIYSLAQTTSNKVKLASGVEEYLKNDTIYVNAKTLSNLIGDSDLDINALKELYADEKGTIWLPVIRHPRDMADNLHFLKLELIDDSEPYNMLLNVDTMKSKFNGDFDGDHISIVKPSKSLSNYAKVIGPYKNSAYSLLDKVMDSIPHTIGGEDTPIIRDNKILKRLLNTHMNILNEYEGDILSRYNELKEQFVNNPHNIKLLTSKGYSEEVAKQYLDDIYLKEPIEIKATAGAPSFITYTDWEGMVYDESNIKNKKIFRNNSLSYALNIAKLDSASGQAQKAKLLQDYNARFKGSLTLEDTAITFSRTTEKVINNNLDLVKTTLLNDNSISDISKAIITNAESADDIEVALRIHQMYQQDLMMKSDEFKQAVKTLQDSDDTFTRAFKRFSSGNSPEEFESNLSEFIYTIDDLEKINPNSGRVITSRNQDNIGKLVDYSRKLTSKGLIKSNNKSQLLEDMATTLPCVYRLPGKGTGLNAMNEDTFMMFNGMNDYTGILPKAIKLDDKNAERIISKYFGDDILSNKVITNKRDLELLGIKNTDNCTVKMGYKTEDNIFVLYRSYGLDTVKTMSRGGKHTKGTPAGNVDLTEFPENLRDTFNFCAVYRDLSFAKGSDINSHFKSYEYTCYDINGNKLDIIDGVIPKDAVWIKTDEDISIMETTPLWSSAPKESVDTLAGNSLFDTGGIVQTLGMFMSFDEKGDLVFDDKGHSEMMRRLAKLNEPELISKDSSELYDLLRFAVLSKNISDKDIPDQFSSIEEYIQHVMEKSDIRSEVEFLKHKVNKQDFGRNSSEEKLIYTLLFDNELENRVRPMTPDTANATNTVGAKGAARRMTAAKSKYASESTGGGALEKEFDIFNNVPNMSVVDLINYLSKASGSSSRIYESNLIQLMEQGLLPVGYFNSEKGSQEDISINNNKIGESVGDVTTRYTGNTFIPTDELGRNVAEEYERYNADTNYYSNADAIRKRKYIDKQSANLAILLKSLKQDKDSKINKYTILDNISPYAKATRVSYDPITYQFNNEGLLQLTPKRYIDTKDTLRSISMDEALTKLYNMRSSPLYFDTLSKAVDPYKANAERTLYSNLSISDDIITNMSSRQNLPEHVADNLGLFRPQDLSDSDLGLTKPDISEDTKHNLERYKKVIYTSQELDQELSRNNLILGDKVVGKRKVFEAEAIRLQNGIKIKDTDDLVQDRNYKQTVVDCVNNQNDLSQDLIKLYNYSVNKNTLSVVNDYTYLQAMRSKLETLESIISKTKDPTKLAKFESDKKSFLDALKQQFGIKDTVELKSKLDAIKKANPTEVFFADKILVNINIQSQKYSRLTNEPGSNLFYLLTNATSTNNKERKATKNFILRLLGNKDQDLIQEKNDVPLYNSYDFMESMNATIKQLAKSKAIYENSIRLKKSGVLDNTKVQDTLIDTLNYYKKTIVEAKDEKGHYREGLQTLFKVLNSKLGTYMDSTLYARFLDIDGRIKDNNISIGQLYFDTFELLSTIAKSTGITYETARLDTTNISDAERFLFCQEVTQDLFASMSALTEDKLVMSLADTIAKYANNNGLTIVDKFGRKKDLSKIYMLHEGSLEFAQTLQDYENEQTFAQGLARDLINGELYLMDKNLADVYAKGLFKEYKKPGKLKAFIQKTSRLATTLLMSSPFKIVDRFLKFTAFDATTLGTANIATFKYEGQAFKDLKAYFMSKGAASSNDLTEFLHTQGINMGNSNFDLVLNMDPDSSPNLFKAYTDKVGNVFTFQTLSQRYAYWLATKASLEKGDYSTLGSAYHLKDAIMGLEGVTDSEGNVKVSKYGNQAAFAMAQMLGSPNDFPGASKTLNEYGFVFTTFPLAAARWGIGEFRSMASAVKGLFSEGLTSQNAKWLFRQSSGLIGTFIAERLLVALICDMFGVTNDEDEEKWKEVGALPNITQSIAQGQPIMDTFSSMNISREVYDLTLAPFINKEDKDNVSGMQKFLYKNVIGHINPLAKNLYEVVAKKDIIDDQVIDTADKYSGFENLFRKMSSYVIGASGANALTKSLTNSDGDYITGFTQGLNNAIQAEMGNTKAQKENIKNYYNMLSLINSYIDYSESEYISNNGDFNYAQYQKVKSVIYSLINDRASTTDIYSAINQLTQQGYTLYEIRAALKNCSIGNKLEKIQDYNSFLSSLTPAEQQNLRTALEYEEFMYPWLEDNVRSINTYINKSNYNLSVPYQAYNTYRPTTNYDYSYYKPSYRNSYTNPIYNRGNNTYNPYDVYKDMINDLAYQRQQAEYARQRKQWEDN